MLNIVDDSDDDSDNDDVRTMFGASIVRQKRERERKGSSHGLSRVHIQDDIDPQLKCATVDI